MPDLGYLNWMLFLVVYCLYRVLTIGFMVGMACEPTEGVELPYPVVDITNEQYQTALEGRPVIDDDQNVLLDPEDDALFFAEIDGAGSIRIVQYESLEQCCSKAIELGRRYSILLIRIDPEAHYQALVTVLDDLDAVTWAGGCKLSPIAVVGKVGQAPRRTPDQQCCKLTALSCHVPGIQ